MDANPWTKTKRSKELFAEEAVNKEGHWARDFRARLEPWPVIEAWAEKHDYHLVAARGHRRLYSRGESPTFSTVFMEVSVSERRTKLSGWIQTGTRARYLSCFLLPAQMPIDPLGSLGVRTRRAACRDLNALLFAFRQPAIIGSETFHASDLDPLTWGLVALGVFALTVFISAMFRGFDFQAKLLPAYFNVLGRWLFGISTCALAVSFFQHRFSRAWPESWSVRLGSFAAGALLLTLVTVLSISKAVTRVLEDQVAYHCVQSFEGGACQQSLSVLPEKRRQLLRAKLEWMEKELAVRPVAGPGL